eukprot:gene873-1092_t
MFYKLHSCDSCIQLAYMKDTVIICLGCGAQIRRQSFINQRFDDTGLEKENTIRRQMVEDLVFDVLEGGEIASAAEQRMKDYQKVNQTSIIVNKAKKEEEDALIATKIAEEQRIATEKRNNFAIQDQKELNSKLLEKAKTMEDLAQGKISAKEVKEIDKKKAVQEQKKQEQQMISEPLPPITQDTSLNGGSTTTTTTTTTTTATGKFSYQPSLAKPMAGNQTQQQAQAQPIAQPHMMEGGQKLFSLPQPLEHFKYDEMALKNVMATPLQAEAAGFKQIYIKQRALEEAFDSLFQINNPIHI